MIFGIGFGLFVFALFFSWCKYPEKAGGFLSVTGVLGMFLMLVSICMLIARFMP